MAQASSLPSPHRAGWKLALIFLTFLIPSGHAFAGKILQDVVARSYPLDPSATVTIRNTDGRIFIYGSDAPRLEISAVRRAFTRARLEAIRVEVSIDGARAAIETIYPPLGEGLFADRSGTVDYIIILPQRCLLERVELKNGEMMIEGMRGAGLDARLGNGIMHVNDCFTKARVHLEQGRLNISYGWWEAEPLEMEATIERGNAILFLPPDASLALSVANRSGNITNRLTSGQSVRRDGGRVLNLQLGAESASEIRLRGGSANVRLERAY